LSLAALEFDRVLELVAAFARSDLGRRAVTSTLPVFSPGEGSRAYCLTSELATAIALQGTLSFTGLDAAELLSDGTATAVDAAGLARLVSLVRRVVEVRAALAAAPLGAELGRIVSELPRLDALLSFCELRLGPGGEVLDSASAELASARTARERHRGAIVAAMERLRRTHANLSAPFTVRRERYCMPVPAAERGTLAGLVLDVSASGATVFLEPLAAVELNNALAEATAAARAEEERVLAELAAAFHRNRDDLLTASARLAELDACQARVLFGQACGGRLLQPGAATSLRLVGARHPLLDPALAALREQTLGETGSTRPVVPLDLAFPEGAKLVLLSGPNAGGKTVALKTLGLAALMAQTGIPVLAEEGSCLPPLGRVWCHLGDEQNLLSELSTFTGAMRATATLLEQANEDTLVLYDELGSGTDPEEGAALAAALLEELARRRSWTLATAHLVTVAAHLESIAGAVNAAMGYDEATGRPTYALHLGVPGRSRGLAIASSCGVPPDLLARARAMLSASFLAIDGYLATLQDERERLIRERDALASWQREAEEERRRAEEARVDLEREQERSRRRLDEEREALRRRAREQLAAAVAELERARERGEFPGKKRLAAVRRVALDLSPEEPTPAALEPFGVGATVRVRGTSSVGQVIRALGDRVELRVGEKRLWVEPSACEPLAPPPTSIHGGIQVTTAQEGQPSEINLIGRTQDEAREELERFLDRAALAGVTHVRVVHGHGTGALRRVVGEVLAAHPTVAHFSHPPQYRGGTGVTEAELG
jgi:DNA mismatch repair protein MutS2